MRWADLRVRIVSAVILAPVAFGCAWFGGVAWVVLICAAGGAVALEWVALCGGRAWSWVGFAAPGSVVAACVGTARSDLMTAAAVLLMGCVACWRASIWRASVAAGVVYAGLAGVALVWLRDDPVAGRANVMLLIVAVIASDIGAYAVGRVVGGPRLAPLISPGKTWSGAAGGLLFAALAGAGVAVAFGSGAVGMAGTVAVFLSAVAQAGDLFESWVKRRSGVKDSGWLIPGHGGVMDRLDGFLAAGPVAAAVAAWLGRGTMFWQ